KNMNRSATSRNRPFTFIFVCLIFPQCDEKLNRSFTCHRSAAPNRNFVEFRLSTFSRAHRFLLVSLQKSQQFYETSTELINQIKRRPCRRAQTAPSSKGADTPCGFRASRPAAPRLYRVVA